MKRAARTIAITATQRLGKRIDSLEREVRVVITRLDATDERLKDAQRELASVASVGSYEAMYRLEREENIRLRMELERLRRDGGHGLAEILTAVESGISEVIERLRPKMCPAHNHQHPVGACGELPLTAAEQRTVDKFKSELLAGLGDGRGLA